MACNDEKCETLVQITNLEGAGAVRFMPFATDLANSHEQLPQKVEVYVEEDGDELVLETDQDTIDAQPIDATIPNKIATFTFSSVTDTDGVCPTWPEGTELSQPCRRESSETDGVSAIKLTWVWTETAYGKRFGMGIGSGKLFERDCVTPGVGDLVLIEGTTWTRLRAPTDAGGETLAQRTGSRTFKVEVCGLVEAWRIYFYDTDIGVDAAGKVDNYFDVKTGLQSCCLLTNFIRETVSPAPE